MKAGVRLAADHTSGGPAGIITGDRVVFIVGGPVRVKARTGRVLQPS